MYLIIIISALLMLGRATSITFVATSNIDLEPREFPSSSIVNDIESLLQAMSAYKTYYEAPVQDENEYSANGPSTDLAEVPDVVLIRGSSDFNSSLLSWPTHSGLIGTVTTAYNYHHNLQLRPDDIWISILTQFSAYVNGRPEQLRDKFVAHKGKTELKVVRGGNIYTVDFGDMASEMLDVIAANIKDESLREWFLPGFATSTVTDNICAAASAMCTLQEYFTYKFVLECGIPEVTLLGTVDDWKRLRCKIDRLLEFDDDTHILSEWVSLLKIIGDNLVESSINGSKNNLHFWDTIVNHVGGGSGPSYINGWISTLSFFDKDGNPYSNDRSNDYWPKIDTDYLNANILSCPVEIDDNGYPYNSTMFVGQMAFTANEESTTPAAYARSFDETPIFPMKLIPRNDWALAISDDFISLPFKSPDESDDKDFGLQRCWCYDDSWGGCGRGPLYFNKTNRHNITDCSLNDNASGTASPSTVDSTLTPTEEQSIQSHTTEPSPQLSASRRNNKSDTRCIVWLGLSSLFLIVI